MTDPTPPDLDALKRLLAEAQDAWNERKSNGQETLADYLKAHARFTVAAVNALPALIAAAREQQRLTEHWCKDGETLSGVTFDPSRRRVETKWSAHGKRAVSAGESGR